MIYFYHAQLDWTNQIAQLEVIKNLLIICTVYIQIFECLKFCVFNEICSKN